MISVTSFRARCGLAVLSGVVFASAFPPFGWGWLVIPGLGGLLWALREQSGTRARAIGFLHGMAAYGVSLSWLLHVFGGMAVMLWCVLAAFTALFAQMQGQAGLRGYGGWKLAIFTTLNWCGWEFIRAELFPLKFPWMTLGLAMGPNRLLPWIGVYGVGLLVIFPVSLLMLRKWKSAAVGFALLILAAVITPRNPAPDATDPLAVKVAGLQLENVSLTEFLEGTRNLPEGTQQIVWPEYAVPYDLRSNKNR